MKSSKRISTKVKVTIASSENYKIITSFIFPRNRHNEVSKEIHPKNYNFKFLFSDKNFCESRNCEYCENYEIVMSLEEKKMKERLMEQRKKGREKERERKADRKKEKEEGERK